MDSRSRKAANLLLNLNLSYLISKEIKLYYKIYNIKDCWSKISLC